VFSGARSNDEIPGLIAAGFRCVCVYMDVWGIAGAVAGNLAIGRKYAQEAAEQSKTKTNGSAVNGKVAVNGKARGMPASSMKSPGPNISPPMPGMDAISSRFSTPLTLSIWGMSTTCLLAVATLNGSPG